MLISCRVGLLLLLTTIFSLSLFAQNNFFAEAREAGITAGIGKRVIIPEKYKTVVLDNLGLQKIFKCSFIYKRPGQQVRGPGAGVANALWRNR